MKKKLLAFLCMLTMLVSVFAFAVPADVEAAASTAGVYQVGYSKKSIDPIDAAGTYRKVKLSSEISDATKAGKFSAYSEIVDSNGYYTVEDYSSEVGVSDAVPQGYFRVPLGGYAGQYDRMSQGRMDDNGDGNIDNNDGMFVTCIVISDGTNTVVMASIDAISADINIVNSVKRAVHSQIPEIPRANIMVTASHSHSGVYTSVSSATYATEAEAKAEDAVAKAKKSAAVMAYNSLMADRITAAIVEAYNSKAAATIEKADLTIVDENGVSNMNFVRHYNVTKKSNWGSSKTTYVSGDNFGGSQTSDSWVDDILYTYTIESVSAADNTMSVLRITYTGNSQQPILFANWRAHPKCNSTAVNNFGLSHRPYSSSDYVNAFRAYLEAQNYRVSFYQGAAGNINTHSNDSSKTNSKTKNSDGLQEGGLYGKLAEYAMTAMGKTTFEAVTGGEIKVKDTLFHGEGVTYETNVIAAAKAWKTAYDKGSVSYPYSSNGFKFNSYYHASAVYGRVSSSDGTEAVTTAGADVVLNAITIGDNLAFVTAPNELYDRYSTQATLSTINNYNEWSNLASAGYGEPFVLGYTNNSKGYVPNQVAYDYNSGSSTYGVGSYEANTSSMKKGEGEKLIATFVTMLQNMNAVESTVEGKCKACGTMVTWQPLNGIYEDTAIDPGHYYMTENAANAMNYQKQINGKVCIDLMGHTYANQSAVTGRSLVVNNGATLSIQDSVGGGKVQGQGTTGSANGGVICVNSGATVNLYNCTVERIVTAEQTANRGGAIYVDGNLNMTNVNIVGGVAKDQGDSIFVNTNGKLNINGGNIPGGVYVLASNKNVTLSGAVVIKGAQKNLYLNNDGSNELNISGLTAGAEIYVTAVRSLGSATYFDYFKADEGTYLDKVGGRIFAGDRYSCECGGKAVGKYGHTCEPIVWAPWPGTVTPPNGYGNYYLKYTCKPTSMANVTGTLRIDLNGKNIERQVSSGTNSAVYSLGTANAQLTITDTVGGGTIKRTLSDSTIEAAHAGTCIMMTGSNTTFRLYAGTIDGQGQKTASGGGGAIAGNNADATPTIEIYGGTIKGATANYGGGIYAKGPVLLAGGTITGGVVNKEGGGVHIDTMGSLILAGDATITGNTTSLGATSNIFCPASKLTIAGTYTGTAGITVSSPAMDKVIGISNNADLSGATLIVDNDTFYEIVTSGNQLKLTASSEMAVKQTNGTDVQYYETMEQALADYAGGNAYLTLRQDIAAATLTVPTKIDLAGHDIAAITLEGTGSLEIMDSATDDFTINDADGYGTVPASVNVTVADGYIKITEGDKVSVHRLDLTLTELTLRPREVGIYYRSRFGGDEVLKDRISEFGLALRANSAPDEDYIVADTKGKTHCEFDGSLWSAGAKNSANSVILKDIMKEENGYLLNKRNGEIPVYGVSYVVLDGQMILGQDYAYTLRQIVETVNVGYDKLSETEKTGPREFYETYESAMKTWNVDKIAEKSFAGKSATFVGDSITYGATLKDSDTRYWGHVRSALNLGSVTNMGVSGSCISDNNDRGHDYKPLTDRYQQIPGTDLIFIFMGTNDWGHNTMITTADYNADYHADKTRTLAVDLNMVVDYLQDKYPESEIILVTPIARHAATKNKIGRTLQDYVDAVKAVGQEQGVVVADIYATTVAQMPLDTHFNEDKVHPNALGHEVLGGILADWLAENREKIFN